MWNPWCTLSFAPHSLEALSLESMILTISVTWDLLVTWDFLLSVVVNIVQWLEITGLNWAWTIFPLSVSFPHSSLLIMRISSRSSPYKVAALSSSDFWLGMHCLSVLASPPLCSSNSFESDSLLLQATSTALNPFAILSHGCIGINLASGLLTAIMEPGNRIIFASEWSLMEKLDVYNDPISLRTSCPLSS